MIRLYENFKKDSASLERKLTPLKYRAMQYAGTGLPGKNAGTVKVYQKKGNTNLRLWKIDRLVLTKQREIAQ